MFIRNAVAVYIIAPWQSDTDAADRSMQMSDSATSEVGSSIWIIENRVSDHFDRSETMDRMFHDGHLSRCVDCDIVKGEHEAAHRAP
jgi:hypothetical protein